ncbi:hypothetical protein BH10ACT3_BH10ACT3_04000 [soil metagenome]
MGDLPNKKDLESQGEAHGFRMNGRLLGGGVVGLLLLAFILSNTQEVSVHFLFMDFRLPMWLVLTVTALLGAAVGTLAVFVRRRQRRKARRADR